MREMDNTYDFVTWLDEVFNQLDLGNDINLVGLSYGGWLTSQYALRFPERLENIVLIAPAATVLPISSEWLGRAALTAIPHPYFTEGFIDWMLADFVNHDEANRDLVKEWAYEAYVAARSFKPKSLANPNVLSNSDLMSLGVRMLFLVGENEKLYSPQAAVERLNTVAPQVETAIIPNAGHDLTMARAALVNRKILEFLGKP
jgi:pimeloyl-ACP methyl ester carboxylesterase